VSVPVESEFQRCNQMFIVADDVVMKVQIFVFCKRLQITASMQNTALFHIIIQRLFHLSV